MKACEELEVLRASRCLIRQAQELRRKSGKFIDEVDAPMVFAARGNPDICKLTGDNSGHPPLADPVFEGIRHQAAVSERMFDMAATFETYVDNFPKVP